MTITLLLDMDGPLADFDGLFWDRCMEAGYTMDVEGRHQQAARFFTEHMPDVHEREAARAWVDGPGWFDQLPVTEGAQEAVEQLLRWPGLDVWVCTKPIHYHATQRDEKATWLRRHFPDLVPRLIIAGDKSMVRGDYLLDDAPEMDHAAVATWKPILFRAPYNGSGSEWGGLGLPRYDWSMGVEALVHYMEMMHDG